MSAAAASLDQRRDPDATRAAILDAAEVIFASCGFADTSTSQIADAASVTKSLIHHHFGSKRGLWQAVLERRFQEYHDTQAAILDRAEGPDTTPFTESFDQFFDFLARNPSFVRLHNWALAEREPLIVDKCEGDDDPLTRRGVATIRSGQERGLMRDDVDAAAVLAAFFSMVEHWFRAGPDLRARFGDDYPHDEVYRDTIKKIFIRGLEAK
jgi:TetR/AcrR family transcriptional regulator